MHPNQGGTINFGFGGTTCAYPGNFDGSVTANGTHPIVLGPALPNRYSLHRRFFMHMLILPMEVLLSLMVVFLLYLPKKHGEVVWYCLVV
ncbi:MAG: hypothetical protein IPI22_11255 [Bacteroidetes bacterium]|nr:hypothetical protein [Bacteroidota bacterium]